METNITSLIGEEWKDVSGFEGLYQASTLGRIKSIKTRVRTFPIILKGVNNKNGYLTHALYKIDLRRFARAHRLIAETFIPNPLNKPQINHKNGIKTDNRACNLEWCDNSENIQHAYDTGLKRRLKGNLNPAAKLKEEEVIEIFKSKETGVLLSKKYSIDRTMISNIRNGKNWNSVTSIIKLA